MSRRLSRRDLLKLGAGLAVAGVLGCEGEEAATPTPGTPSAGQAPSGPPVKVGVLVPTSGVYTALGRDMLNGYNLYFQQVNFTAGGRRIELITEDETGDANTALTRARKLIEADRVEVFTGVVSTAAVYAMRDLLHQSRTLSIITNAGGNDLTRGRKSPYIFRTSFTSWQVSFPLGKWVADNLTKRVAIMYADYGFGQESQAAFRESFTAAGGQVLDAIPFPLGNSDFSSVIDRIRAARPDAVYGFASGSDAVLFLRQFAQAGLRGRIPLAVTGFMVEQDVLQSVGRDALDAYSSLHWAVTLDNPTNRRFVEEYRRRYNEFPSVFTMQAYDGARVIVEVLNAVNGDTSDPDRLVRAAEAVRFDSPRGLFEFDPVTHNVIQNVYLRQVRDQGGQVVNVVVTDLGRVRDPG
ncbi:Leucine-, isoleucine-, valine-, threonine-, and alanine-binding protein [bacterium HR24]|nr:Leucine-, isoleucine-, valine-, threonine-, and alanine-binding protein [bacterium HR24]